MTKTYSIDHPRLQTTWLAPARRRPGGAVRHPASLALRTDRDREPRWG